MIIRRSLSFAMLAALAIAVLQTGQPTTADAQTPHVIRLGFLGTDVSSGPLYADASGAFARGGLGVRLKSYRKAFQPLAALKAGELDIGFSDVISAVDAIQAGVPVVILAPAGMYDSRTPITVLLAGKSRRIHSGADLDGKTLAVPASRDLGEIATRNWIDRHGGHSGTVRYTHSIGFADIADALNNGTVDAAEMSEPIKTEIAPRTSFVANTFDDIAPKFAIGVYLARRSWVDANPDAARRFTIAMSAAARWANAHHAQTASILARRYHIPAAVVATMVRASYPEHLTAALMQPVIDVAAHYGICRRVDAATLLP